MSVRAMWKAEVHLGSERLPVRMYAAVEDVKVHFRLLHAEDLAPVEQAMVDPDAGRIVPSGEVRRGLEVREGTFVVLDADELQAIEPPPSRAIEVEQVVRRAALDVRLYDRPYYLGPDADAERYFALAEALARRDSVGVARWTMRKTRYRGALFERDGYLQIVTLRSPAALVDVGTISPPASRAPERRELALAEQLIESLAGDFDPAAYHDAYQASVRKLLEAKANGSRRQRLPPRPRPSSQERSLADELEASLGKQRKVAHAG